MTQDEMYQARMAPAMKAEIQRLEANDKLYAVAAKAYQAEISALQRTAKASCERADGLEHEVVMLKAKISNLEGQVAYRDSVVEEHFDPREFFDGEPKL